MISKFEYLKLKTIEEAKLPTQNRSCEIPKEVLQSMEANGAKVEKVPGEALVSITEIQYGDAAWKIYEAWAENIDKDPRVFIGFFPSKAVRDSTLSPSRAVGAEIVVEAISILSHYSRLMVADFHDNVPIIGPPLEDVPMFIVVHHAKLALSSFMERIQNPPANYPVLSALKSGSYICTVDQQWANAGVNITIQTLNHE